MLEPWIIEQIRRREEEERRRNERPQLEVPLRDERWKRPAGDEDKDKDKDKDKDDESSDRGVVIIDF